MHWNSNSLPPTWFMAMYAACTAGPMHDSTCVVSANARGMSSSSASTHSRHSERFTTRSSGAGQNTSSSSATTIICGASTPLFSE